MTESLNNRLAIEVADLTVAYRDQPVLWDVDLNVPSGVLMAIVGPNGAGKTTLIKAILGLVAPAAGRVLIYGQPYVDQRRLVGYVPQRGSVDWDFPTSVLDVVMMGCYGTLGWGRRPGRRERARGMTALENVGMLDFADRQISQLSGGQQQRVSWHERWCRMPRCTSWTNRLMRRQSEQSFPSCKICELLVRLSLLFITTYKRW